MPKLQVVQNPNGDDLEFEGELIIDEQGHDIGFVQIWKTDNGSYILKQNRSSRPGVRTIHRVDVFRSPELVVDALGHSPGAKRIANELGVSRKTRID